MRYCTSLNNRHHGMVPFQRSEPRHPFSAPEPWTQFFTDTIFKPFIDIFSTIGLYSYVRTWKWRDSATDRLTTNNNNNHTLNLHTSTRPKPPVHLKFKFTIHVLFIVFLSISVVLDLLWSSLLSLSFLKSNGLISVIPAQSGRYNSPHFLCFSFAFGAIYSSAVFTWAGHHYWAVLPDTALFTWRRKAIIIQVHPDRFRLSLSKQPLGSGPTEGNFE